MKRNISFIFLFSAGFLCGLQLFNIMGKVEADYRPSDWFYFQRVFPNKEIPFDKYYKAIHQKMALSKFSKAGIEREWIPVGPYNIGGRITALDVDPSNKNIIYAGAAAGGIFITTDGGKTWNSKTDYFESLSVGALRINPNDPSVIYCGTGEANSSGDSYPGFGILKSTDYGETWLVSGLVNTRHIGEIEIHPLNSNIIYAAVAGGLYTKDKNRGVYKSTDGGSSWEKSLFVNDSTSVIDVAVDPSDVNIVYAAAWERMRGPSFRKASGLNSGIYKSTNAGEDWFLLSNGLPLPSERNGRISIAVAKSNPNNIYALYKVSNDELYSNSVFGGFYKSTDKGHSWNQMANSILRNAFFDFGWYFGLLEVDHYDPDIIYIGGIDLLKSIDGGSTWENLTNSYSSSQFVQQHPDQHTLWINPVNTNNLITGNDGGIFTSTNGGSSWTKLYDLPISQFYASTIDFLLPHRKYGGTQDNGTLATLSGKRAEWQMIHGGDGFHTIVDYTNSDIIYCESQWGGLVKSTNAGNSFTYAKSGISNDRTNWSTPFIMDLNDPNILFFGTYRIYKSTNGAENWKPISPDLTRGPNGRQGTITCITSAVIEDSIRIIYAGTDDGKISVSLNSGELWKDVTGELPLRYVTDILADKRNPAIAYTTLSGFNLDNTNPHIFRTSDYGNTWNDISGNLPDVPLNSVIIDYDDNTVLYVGGDAGVYYTTDLGNNWYVLGKNLPNSPVFDLNYHQPEKKLVAATHGRSMFETDISGIVSTVDNEESIAKDFILYQNYPNPFNSETKIRFKISNDSYATLKIYNLNGEEIETVFNQFAKSGIDYNVKFNAVNISSGIYFYKLESDGNTQTKKMILLR